MSRTSNRPLEHAEKHTDEDIHQNTSSFDEEERVQNFRQELLHHPVTHGAKEDDPIVEHEHTWLLQHKETLIPRHFNSLPVHKYQNLKEVGLVVFVDYDERCCFVPHVTLDLPQKLDHLTANDGGLSNVRHQPVQLRERVRLHVKFTSGSHNS